APRPLGKVTMAKPTSVKIHYDVGWKKFLTVRGADEPLSWTTGLAATWHPGDVWVASWSMAAEQTEIKVLLDDEQWNVGANYRIRAGETRDLFPFFRMNTGCIETLHHFDT